MKTAKSEVKSNVRKLQAKQERLTLQARDDMFRTKDKQHFNLHKKRLERKKLVVDGTAITETVELRTCWKTYFTLAQSQMSESESSSAEIDHKIRSFVSWI